MWRLPLTIREPYTAQGYRTRPLHSFRLQKKAPAGEGRGIADHSVGATPDPRRLSARLALRQLGHHEHDAQEITVGKLRDRVGVRVPEEVRDLTWRDNVVHADGNERHH